MVEKDVEMFLEACVKGTEHEDDWKLRADVEVVHATFVQKWN